MALISLMGSQVFNLVASAVSPEEPGKFKADELIQTLKKQLHPSKSVAVARYEFFRYRQDHDETARELERKLKTLASVCQFGENLEDCLRDQFVCAQRSAEAARVIFLVKSEDYLKMKLEDVVTRIEATEILKTGIRQIAEVDPFHKGAGDGKRTESRKKCSWCGSVHEARKCPAWNAENVEKRGILRKCVAVRRQPKQP